MTATYPPYRATRRKIRFKQHTPCPICGGGEDMPRGRGLRCTGWQNEGDDIVHCSREEHAGQLQREANSTYPHRLTSGCRCGTAHGGQTRVPATNSAGPTPLRRLVATYDYPDPNPAQHYQVLRYADPKGFSQQRANPEKPGAWIANMEGVQTRLYRRPELLAADPNVIVLDVEGERDVDNLRLLDYVAVCNPGGAGKWRDSYSEDLRGRDVVIFPDNDDPGRQHAEQVARSLYGKARSIRVVALPDLPEKGDASDWLAAGGTREELDRLIALAPEWRPVPATPAAPAADGQTNAVLLTKIRELQARVTYLEDRDQRVMAVLSNPKFSATEAITLIKLVRLGATAAPRDRHRDGTVPVTLGGPSGLAQRWACNPKRLGEQLGRFHEAGIITRVQGDPITITSPRTGRNVTIPQWRLQVDDELAALERAIDLPVAPAAQLKRGQGSKPRRPCPDHPHARVIRRSIWICEECGQVIDQEDTTEAPAPTGPPPPPDAAQEGAYDDWLAVLAESDAPTDAAEPEDHPGSFMEPGITDTMDDLNYGAGDDQGSFMERCSLPSPVEIHRFFERTTVADATKPAEGTIQKRHCPEGFGRGHGDTEHRWERGRWVCIACDPPPRPVLVR
jgi:hypothetical protein